MKNSNNTLKNSAKPIFSVLLLLLFCNTAYAVTFAEGSVGELYPEDYSFRSGLTYKVEYYGTPNVPGVQGPLYSEEENYWTSRYPFANPFTDTQIYTLGDVVPENTGFKIKVVRRTNQIGGDISQNIFDSGFISHSISLLPFLEAKETKVYDGDGKKYATLTRLDQYGNPVEVYDYGYVGSPAGNNDDGVQEYNFRQYYVRDPRHITDDTEVLVYSGYTNLQKTSLLEVEEQPEAFKDTRITKTEYFYKNNPVQDVYPDIVYNPSSMDQDDIKALYEFYGWNIPVKVEVIDAFGRVLSQTQTDYETLRDNFGEDCPDIFFEKDYLCIDPACPIIHPFDNQHLYEDCSISPTGGLCIRMAPNHVVAKNNPYTSDYLRASGGTEDVVASRLQTIYDECGNPTEMTFQAKYKDPWNNLGLDAEGFEKLSDYEKTIQTTYSPNRMRPVIVKTLGVEGSPLSLTINAAYFEGGLLRTVLNERNIPTQYDYDEMGRLTKYWITPDTSASPTAKYEYTEYSTPVYLGCKWTYFSCYPDMPLSCDTFPTDCTEFDHEDDFPPFDDGICNWGTGSVEYLGNCSYTGPGTGMWGYRPTYTYINDFQMIKEERKLEQGKYLQAHHFYDGMGRHIQTQTKSPEEDYMIVMTKIYDVNGKLLKQTKPAKVNLQYSDDLPLKTGGGGIYDNNCPTEDFDSDYSCLQCGCYDGYVQADGFVCPNGPDNEPRYCCRPAESENSHLACVDNSCHYVSGDGPNQCSDDTDCFTVSDGAECMTFGAYYDDFQCKNTDDLVLRSYYYDDFSRLTKIVDFDGEETIKQYTTLSDASEGFVDVVSVTDPEQNKRTFYSDSRGSLVGVELPELQ